MVRTAPSRFSLRKCRWQSLKAARLLVGAGLRFNRSKGSSAPDADIFLVGFKGRIKDIRIRSIIPVNITNQSTTISQLHTGTSLLYVRIPVDSGSADIRRCNYPGKDVITGSPETDIPLLFAEHAILDGTR